MDVATVTDGPAEIDSYTFLGVGPAAPENGIDAAYAAGSEHPAVTLSIAKRIGSDATRVANEVLAKVERLEGTLIPADVHLTVTRNYGETAKDKASQPDLEPGPGHLPGRGGGLLRHGLAGRDRSSSCRSPPPSA